MKVKLFLRIFVLLLSILYLDARKESTLNSKNGYHFTYINCKLYYNYAVLCTDIGIYDQKEIVHVTNIDFSPNPPEGNTTITLKANFGKI